MKYGKKKPLHNFAKVRFLLTTRKLANIRVEQEMKNLKQFNESASETKKAEAQGLKYHGFGY